MGTVAIWGQGSVRVSMQCELSAYNNCSIDGSGRFPQGEGPVPLSFSVYVNQALAIVLSKRSCCLMLHCFAYSATFISFVNKFLVVMASCVTQSNLIIFFEKIISFMNHIHRWLYRIHGNTKNNLLNIET